MFFLDILTGLDGTVKIWRTAPVAHTITKSASPLEMATELLSKQLVKTFHTKNTAVWHARFSPRNLLYTAGVYKSA